MTCKERGIQRGNSQRKGADYDMISFTELPGTKEETQYISEILTENSWETNLFLGDKALEDDLKRVSEPSVLHIATHGFFNADVSEKSNHISLGTRDDISFSNPLLRSGLLFAGASHTARGDYNSKIENGILTAYEAMNLNLKEISACETGLGEIINGEGVYGLQRAFQVAGSHAVLMSLWKVDDEATKLLMTTFYESWLNGASKSKALQQAQETVRKQFDHPYYWGAFVMVEN